MIAEENEVFDNEAAEGGGNEDIKADEVDADSANHDHEADDEMGEDEEDTDVGEVENSVGSEDDCEAAEDGSGGGGSNDEVGEGPEEEDDEGLEEEDDEDDEGLEEEDDEDDEGGSNDEDDEGENYDRDDGGTEEEEDPSEYMDAHLTYREKWDFEIFVSRLDKKTVEDDLQEAFAPFGPIQAMRIVRHPVKQKSKGFAFIRYAAAEHAKRAPSELKDGEEVVH